MIAKILNKIKNLTFNRFDTITTTVIICSVAIIFLRTYYFGTCISPDSANYLRAARGIADGNGFYVNKLAGDVHFWFATWPIGYPALIAMVACITKTNVYLSAKILSVLVLLVIVGILRRRFKSRAWLFSVSFLMSGFIWIFSYVWSEQLLLLGLLWFSFALYDVLCCGKVSFARMLSLSFSSLFLFLSRYIGAFSIVAMSFFAGLIFLEQVLRKLREPKEQMKAVWLLIVSIINAILMYVYLYNNKIHSGFATGMERIPAPESFSVLTKQLVGCELREISSLFAHHGWLSLGAVLSLVVLGILFFLVWKHTRALINYLLAYRSHPGVILGAVGLFYWVCIVLMRFRTQFDQFNFRLLYPATFMFLIAALSVLVEVFPEKTTSIEKKIRIQHVLAICLIMVFLLNRDIIRLYGGKVTGRKLNGYEQMKSELLEKYKTIDSGALVLGYDINALFLRPDLQFDTPRFAPYFRKETMENCLLRLKDQRTIIVDVEVMKNELKEEGRSYDCSVYEYFHERLKPGEYFVKIK